MVKVFVNTNVILDFVLCREGEQQAMDLFQMAEEGKIEVFVSFLTMANVAYVARKHRTREELYEYLRELSSLFKILSMKLNFPKLSQRLYLILKTSFSISAPERITVIA